MVTDRQSPIPPALPAAAASGGARRQPRLRLRMRTVLMAVSLFVLALPLASLQVLRIYEGVLLRQTEAALAVQGAFAAAAYRADLRRALGADAARYGRPLPGGAQHAADDLAETRPLPPLPAARPAQPVAAAVQRAGSAAEAVLRDAAAATGAQLRILNPDGIVVASTVGDLGRSLAHWQEVRAALAGSVRSTLRRTDAQRAPIAAISRNTALLVVVAQPIVADAHLVGVALLSRSPGTILATLLGQRELLAQATALVVAVVVGIALLAARTLVLPVRRIQRAARRLSQGEADSFEGGRPYRVIELAELAASVESMADTLQKRAAYVHAFARHVNHEFKTPIAAMRGAVELLREHIGQMAPSERERFLNNLDADIERLQRLTLRLLELAYADTARVGDETACIGDAAAALGGAARFAGDAAARARISRASLEAVLKHLCDNALECGARRVSIRAARAAERVLIDVTDDGPGISEGNRARIFEPFFTTRRNRGGTGLGLAISQAIVVHAGGAIELLPSDSGARFRIALPDAGGAEGAGEKNA